MDVPYVDLVAQHQQMKQDVLDAVERVLDHGIFIGGEEVEQFEQRMADYLDVPHVIGLNSGTDALILALKARGIGEGDEVITVSHSWVTTASAIALTGATPVFVDIDPDTMLMDPNALEDAVTDRTEAILPVHYNGNPADLDAIEAVCDRHDLSLIEDCAQALGTRYDNELVGTRDIGCFSTHPLKVLSACGDGGFIALHDDDEAELVDRLHDNGRESRNKISHIARNSRLDTLQASILLEKLDHLEKWIAARRRNAAVYRDALEEFDQVQLPPAEQEGERLIYTMFVLRHPRRDELQDRLQQQGIDAKVHYPIPIHRQEAFDDYDTPELPVTDEVCDKILSLPVTPELTIAQRDHAVEVLQHELQDL
jgi:dTDP-4-amino-4,6-dideoxygalactose transaminase